MSIQAALDFFRTVRQRPDLQARMTDWGPAPSASQLVDLAGELGFTVTESDLMAAFRHDWVMRWLHSERPSGREER